MTLKLSKNEPNPMPSTTEERFSNKAQARATPEAGHTADAKPGGMAS